MRLLITLILLYLVVVHGAGSYPNDEGVDKMAMPVNFDLGTPPGRDYRAIIAEDGPPESIADELSNLHGHATIDLAAGGDMDVASAVRSTHRGAVVVSQGDPLAVTRLGAGFNRRMLRERAVRAAAERALLSVASHDPEMLSLASTLLAQEATQAAATTGNSYRAAQLGHLAGEHATFGDPYDNWNMLSGRVNGRRLAQSRGKGVDPALMQLHATEMIKDAVGAAAGGGSAAHAARVGAEAGLITAVDSSLDTLQHVAVNEVPEGVLARPPHRAPADDDWPKMGSG